MSDWTKCRKVLCVRADNMGDVIMSGPAIRAIKEFCGCQITLLTSSMGASISSFIPEIDDVMTADLPWVKLSKAKTGMQLMELAKELGEKQFDGAVIFTVYSQSALPAAMLCYLAGIPLRLGYCRENPYELLTDWVPDDEPFSFIRHQVERDIALVQTIGAQPSSDELKVIYPAAAVIALKEKLKQLGLKEGGEFLVAHPGVSDPKREYPLSNWKETITQIRSRINIPILITGGKADAANTDSFASTDGVVFNLSGQLDMGEFIALLSMARVILTVNTVTAHLAAALQKPVVVLYAMTNPQHTPWKTTSRVLEFSPVAGIPSKNQVITYVDELISGTARKLPKPEYVATAVHELWSAKQD